jgi:hypothetical protein
MEIPQGHTPSGVVGYSGVIEWDVAATNYVNGLYGLIYENYTPVNGTRSALWS